MGVGVELTASDAALLPSQTLTRGPTAGKSLWVNWTGVLPGLWAHCGQALGWARPEPRSAPQTR